MTTLNHPINPNNNPTKNMTNKTKPTDQAEAEAPAKTKVRVLKNGLAFQNFRAKKGAEIKLNPDLAAKLEKAGDIEIINY